MNDVIEKIQDLQVALMRETNRGEYDLLVDTYVYERLKDHFFHMTRYVSEETVKDFGRHRMTINGPGGSINIHENKIVEIDTVTLDMEPF